jgi:hypothetical protein
VAKCDDANDNPWKLSRRGKQILARYAPAHDAVNRPAHYTQGKIEVLDFIMDQRFGYLDGQVIKYVSRYRHKGAAVQDLQKAEFYLKRLIAEVQRHES